MRSCATKKKQLRSIPYFRRRQKKQRERSRQARMDDAYLRCGFSVLFTGSLPQLLDCGTKRRWAGLHMLVTQCHVTSVISKPTPVAFSCVIPPLEQASQKRAACSSAEPQANPRTGTPTQDANPKPDQNRI